MLGPIEDETEFDEVLAGDDLSSTYEEQPDGPVLLVPSTTPKKFIFKGIVFYQIEGSVSDEVTSLLPYQPFPTLRFPRFGKKRGPRK
jgi:hypothetical protein